MEKYRSTISRFTMPGTGKIALAEALADGSAVSSEVFLGEIYSYSGGKRIYHQAGLSCLPDCIQSDREAPERGQKGCRHWREPFPDGFDGQAYYGYNSGGYEEFGSASGSISYELTESAYAGVSEDGNSFLTKMHEEGTKLLVDDFGSGVSSFSTIRDFDFGYFEAGYGICPENRTE